MYRFLSTYSLPAGASLPPPPPQAVKKKNAESNKILMSNIYIIL